MRHLLLGAFLALACTEPEPAPDPIIIPETPAPLPEPKICDPCVPERTTQNPEVDPDCPCVWTKALSLTTTTYAEDEARTHNLKRATSLIYGTVLEPNEGFSFNAVVGPRSKENGFKKAPVVFDSVLTEDLGGGVCQVSSTLHKAVLEAGIAPSRRRPHSRPSSYIKIGLDAAVSWPEQCWDKPESECPRIDFKFENPYDFPIGLKMWVEEEAKQVVAGVYANEPPDLDIEITSRFSYRDEPEVRRQESPWVKKEKLLQKGQPGRFATVQVTVLNRSTGVVNHRKFHSRYPPVPEVWSVPQETDSP